MSDVGGDEPVQQSVLAAARLDRAALLSAMRDLIATQLDKGVAPRDLASLTKRLADISEELEKLATAGDGEAAGGIEEVEFKPRVVERLP
ncbi:hypothetical protein [Pseudoclavibacter terrae]|uniref:Terminase small subunit n=1 Tax=Pseudoclavibacter terrae TaxID=1530195 RepID=A0A7J5B6U4_9MICO|nr:hypothetical protein [Pseudoclavibacter terrae]KAB1639857.1 hypothetical protein F8O03_05985 [Pseudoclavibacter terrae]